MGKIMRSPNEDDVYDGDTAEWLKATDQLVYGDPPLDPDREKRFDVWLNRRHQETIEHARKVTAALLPQRSGPRLNCCAREWGSTRLYPTFRKAMRVTSAPGGTRCG
jgi:hypothetical protein